MLKTIAITIVICLTFHTEYVDVYQHSDYKTVDVYKRQIPAETKTKIDDENNVIGKVDTVDSGQQKNDQPKTDEKINDKKNETITPPIVTNDKINETESFLIKNNTIITHAKVEHNGAIYRSFYVFFGLSVIVLIYISFRTFKYVSDSYVRHYFTCFIFQDASWCASSCNCSKIRYYWP